MFTSLSWLTAFILLLLKAVGAISISGWWIALFAVLPFFIGVLAVLIGLYAAKKLTDAFVNIEQGSGVTPIEPTPEQLERIQQARNELIN